MTILSSKQLLNDGTLSTGEGRILLSFYADDFSGATATAEALTDSGIPTLVFTEPPTVSTLEKRFSLAKAVGIAGVARSLPVDKLETVLIPILEKMREYTAPVILYKVCSTFDSSPSIGSIGRAIEIAKRVFSPPIIPILPAAPRLGRYTVFGHHFAALGQGVVYRLDRHPSMAHHPVTPMNESDLALHLAKQTDLESGLINVLALHKGKKYVEGLLDHFIARAIPVVFFDCLYEEHLILACEVIWRRASRERPMVLVGSQELGYGFGTVWRSEGLVPCAQASFDDEKASDKGPILVLSGSCAEMTSRQILWAIDNGFIDVSIQPQKLLDPIERHNEQTRVIEKAVTALRRGASVVAHTAIGKDDARVHWLREKAHELSITDEAANALLGHALGDIALRIVEHSDLKRLVIVGGDTAGRVQEHLRIQAFQVARSVGIAAPLCYVYSDVPCVNGLEVAFKGGQIGDIDYFGQARVARTLNFEAAALGKPSPYCTP